MTAASTDAVVAEFTRALEGSGLSAGLRYLNKRTPHRFTGIYRYDGDVLRNVCLVDAFDDRTTKGDDVAMGDAYCAVVGQRREDMSFADAKNDPRFAHKPGSPVVCYCGVLLRDARNEPFGTLCHFDVKPCEDRSSDMPILQSVGPLVMRAVYRELRL